MSTILAVDDSIVNLKSIRHLLTPTYKIVAVSSAKDAFHYLEEERPDLILLDIMMPEMDGFEMAHILKKDSKTSDIPIIFLTADEDRDREREGLQAGAVDFIRKPFEPGLMLTSISKVLNR